jgi:hypothetical protein
MADLCSFQKVVQMKVDKWTFFNIFFVVYWLWSGYTYLEKILTQGFGTGINPNLPPVVNFFMIIFMSPVIFGFIWFYAPFYCFDYEIKQFMARFKKEKVTVEDLQEKVLRLEKIVEDKNEMNELLFTTIMRLVSKKEEGDAWEEIDVTLQQMESEVPA